MNPAFPGKKFFGHKNLEQIRALPFRLQVTGTGPAQKYKNAGGKTPGMMQQIKDTAGAGILLWLIGYLASLVLFFSPFTGIMGWVLIAIFTPVTIAITWWWFRGRDLSFPYYAAVGIAWAVIAVVLDYLFIVLLFHATYYGPDVFVYYALTFLIPVGMGLLNFHRKPSVTKE